MEQLETGTLSNTNNEYLDYTNEFSFILRPDRFNGVGLFCTHGIKKGTRLILCRDDEISRKMHKSEIQEDFLKYCVYKNGIYHCPGNFNSIPLIWYINHSDNPNTVEVENDGKYIHYSVTDIEKGEEITVDYRTLYDSIEEFLKDNTDIYPN